MNAQETNPEKPCPLCLIPDREVLAQFSRWKLVRTKTMKGHRERFMILLKEHLKVLDEQSVGEAYMLLFSAGQKFFAYSTQWAIFEPVYATVPDHWHRVASDLDSSAEDYEQILKTPRLVVDTETMTIHRLIPETGQPTPSTTESTRGQNSTSRVGMGNP